MISIICKYLNYSVVIANFLYIIVHYYICTTITLGAVIESWLRMDDDVFTKSGEPTWSSLVVGLESVGHTILTDKIKSKRVYMRAYDYYMFKCSLLLSRIIINLVTLLKYSKTCIIVDPPMKERCMLDLCLYTRGTA